MDEGKWRKSKERGISISKEFMRPIIETIELRPEKTDEGRTLKRINLSFRCTMMGRGRAANVVV